VVETSEAAQRWAENISWAKSGWLGLRRILLFYFLIYLENIQLFQHLAKLTFNRRGPANRHGPWRLQVSTAVGHLQLPRVVISQLIAFDEIYNFVVQTFFI
jgi:hypothetical protein